MPEKNEVEIIKPHIVVNDLQTDPIILDISKGSLQLNKEAHDKLTQLPNIIKRGESLVNTDVKDLSENDMTKLNKEMRPILNYAKTFNDMPKSIRKAYNLNRDAMVDAFDKTINESGFDKLDNLTKELKQKQKDFKANRANQRWEEIHQVFNGNLETYPEFIQYAKSTLGSFNYFRTHHPDLVSSAKTKPVTDKDIAFVNQELYQIHEGLAKLFGSTLNKAYYQEIIDQYAANPTPQAMDQLIETGLAQQIKDEQSKIVDQFKNQVRKYLVENLMKNDKLENLLKKGVEEYPNLQAKIPSLLRQESKAINASFNNIENYVDDKNEINNQRLNNDLKLECESAFSRISDELATEKAVEIKNQKQIKASQTNQTKPETPKPKEKIKSEPKPEPEPYAWVLEYFQTKNWQNIHNEPKLKYQAINEMYHQLNNKSSIWFQHVNNYEDIIKLNQYLIDL